VGDGGRVWESVWDVRGIIENRPPLRHGAVSREGASVMHVCARVFLATKQPCALVREFEKF
jgi:hypothetical protein